MEDWSVVATREWLQVSPLSNMLDTSAYHSQGRCRCYYWALRQKLDCIVQINLDLLDSQRPSTLYLWHPLLDRQIVLSQRAL